jgi:hypothetical protein
MQDAQFDRGVHLEGLRPCRTKTVTSGGKHVGFVTEMLSGEGGQVDR